MKAPLVSVVMSVRNGGLSLLDSIHSVLDQEGVDIEFIIIDDGSTDDTLSILLNVSSKDTRVKVLQRKHRGLTASLIEGCKEAQGKLIARQDAYDFSLQNRLKQQAHILESTPEASMCSSYVRFITKEKVSVFTQKTHESLLSEGLSGVIHGSTMFKKDDYLKVGGYRQEFYYAQDVDLWSRLVEVGKHVVVPHILYENLIYPGSISGSRRKEQLFLHHLISRATKARRLGFSEDRWLKKASFFSQKCRANTATNHKSSDGAYFIGSCLLKTDPSLAKKYFEMSLKSNPLNIKARLKVLSIQ
jgi:glycosyltransferase involved in cell wall biosynthesis